MLKKRKFSLIILFSLLSNIIFSQKKFVLVLDAGHGGSDIGAHRRYEDIGDLREKDVTLAIVLKLNKLLEKNKDIKVINTRTDDSYPSLSARTDLANANHADLFIAVHCNSSAKLISAVYGTETYVQGPDQNKTNLEVAKRENSVIYLDKEDKERFESYNPSSPESMIALKINQQKYLESSLRFGGLVEENFVNKDKRFSRGVMQKNLHVLRLNAMPSVLIETGFINHDEEGHYLSSEKGQQEIAESIYQAILSYKKLVDRNVRITPPVEEKKPETPLRNDFRILLMASNTKYINTDPALRGLNYILTIKEGDLYKYYYAVTNYASVRDSNLKTAKDAGFHNAVAIGFVPNARLNGEDYYTIEVYTGKDRLKSDTPIMSTLKDVVKDKRDGVFYYTYGKTKTIEEAVKLQKSLEQMGIKNTVIEKITH